MFSYLSLNPKKKAAYKRINDEAARLFDEYEARSRAEMLENMRITGEKFEEQLQQEFARGRYEVWYETREKHHLTTVPYYEVIPLLALKKEYGAYWFWEFLFEDYQPFVLEDWVEKEETNAD